MTDMTDQADDERVVTVPNRAELEQRLRQAFQEAGLSPNAQDKIFPMLLEDAGQEFSATDITTAVVWATDQYLACLPVSAMLPGMVSGITNTVFAAIPKLIEAFTDDPEIRRIAADQAHMIRPSRPSPHQTD